MKVLLINGSQHQKGCTYTALSEAASALNEEGIETDFYWIGSKPIGGCIGCFQCSKKEKCVFDDTKERTLYKYVNGQAIKKKFKPEPGQKCVNRENIVYSLEFTVTPHQLRHTYITNLIYAGIDPKTVQYLAGHENSKVTMDIYAKAKYNKPEELSSVVNSALKKLAKSDSG